MPGTTTVQGFPYPVETEAATPVSAQNLATEVDVELTAADAQRTLALNRPTAQASSSTTQLITLNTNTTLTLDTEDWDVGGLYTPGTHRLTFVANGVYMIGGFFYCSSWPDNTVTVEANILLNNSSTIVLNKRGQQNDPANGFGDDICISITFLRRFVATDFIQLRCNWTGSGAPRAVSQTTLWARQVIAL